MFRGLWRDVRVATRRLAATPLFLLFAVLSLAVGLSVTVMAYALVDATFWRHTGMKDPSRVVVLTVPVVSPRGPTATRTRASVLSLADIDDLKSAQHSFSSLAVLGGLDAVLVSDAISTTIRTEAVGGEYFRVAAVAPLLGRTIAVADDREGHQVIVLSEGLWRRRFASRPDVIGRAVRFDGRTFDVIGVAPRRFGGTRDGAPIEAWIPLGATTVQPGGFGRDDLRLSLIARLAPDRSMESASAELRSISQRLDAVRPLRRGATSQQSAAIARSWAVIGIEDQDPLGTRVGWFLVLLVAIVLVVACTNLANLMLARGALRQHEIAIRRALGGARSRLVREVVVESVILAMLGAIASVMLTRVLFLFIPQEVATNAGLIDIAPIFSLRLFVSAGVALLVSLCGFGVEPALQLTRQSVSHDLMANATSARAPRLRRQRVLMGVQVALCTCFFAVTAAAARIALDEARHDSGVDLDHLAIAAVAKPTGWDDARVRRAVDGAAQVARSSPELARVALISGVPFGASGRFAAVTTPDKPFSERPLDEDNGALVMGTTPGALDVLGIALIDGRMLDARDDEGARTAAVINESMARRLFGTRQVIDREIVIQNERRQDIRTLTIVGVVRDTDTLSVYSRRLGAIYVPLPQLPSTLNVFLVARSSDPAAAARSLQAALRQVNPDLAPWFVGPGSVLMAGEYVAARVAAALAVALGGIALFLAMVGLFGLQSQLAARCTRETGIRMALGATLRDIRRWMMRDGMQPVLIGVVCGLLLSVLARLGLRATTPLLITVVDPAVLLLAPIPLALAAWLACRIPAMRAARIPPSVALRQL